MRNISRKEPSAHTHENFASYLLKNLLKNFYAKKAELSSTFFAFRLRNNDFAIRMQPTTHYCIPEMTESLVGKADDCFDSEHRNDSALAEVIFF